MIVCGQTFTTSTANAYYQQQRSTRNGIIKKNGSSRFVHAMTTLNIKRGLNCLFENLYELGHIRENQNHSNLQPQQFPPLDPKFRRGEEKTSSIYQKKKKKHCKPCTAHGQKGEGSITCNLIGFTPRRTSRSKSDCANPARAAFLHMMTGPSWQ